MSLEGDSHVNSQSETGDQKSSNQGNEPPGELPPTGNQLQSPPPADPPSHQEGSKWRENTKLGLEIVGLAALIIYTIFSVLQWAQIRWTNRLTREALNGSDKALAQTIERLDRQIAAAKEANDLTRAMVKGTQSAYFRIMPELQRHAENDPRPVMVLISFTNRGIASASQISGKVRYTRRGRNGNIEETSEQPIGASIVGNTDQFARVFATSAPNDMPTIRWQIITVDGTVSYDNGIGERPTQPFCFTIVFQGSGAYSWEACDNANADRKRYANLP